MSCKYCKSDVVKIIVSETDKDVSIYKSGHMFRVDYRDDGYGMQSELIKFNNCPMCGRKLNGSVNKHEVGNGIFFIRKSLGLTMKEFGELVGNPVASDSIVSRWEKGKSLPNNKRLKRIAEIGGITVVDLIGEDDSNE